MVSAASVSFAQLRLTMSLAASPPTLWNLRNTRYGLNGSVRLHARTGSAAAATDAAASTTNHSDMFIIGAPYAL